MLTYSHIVNRISICILNLTICFAPLPVLAETWRVTSMEGFGPFNYTKDGEYTGIDVIILNEAASNIGVKLDHTPLPWKRAIFNFEHNEFDAIFQLAPSEERLAKFNMIGPLRKTRTVFAVTSQSPINSFSVLADLSGLTVGVVSGFVYEEDFDKDVTIIKEEAPDDFSNIRKLLLGRVDIVVGGEATIKYVAKELAATKKLRILTQPLAQQERYIGFHKTLDGDDKGKRLQYEIDNMHASGRIKQIIEEQLSE